MNKSCSPCPTCLSNAFWIISSVGICAAGLPHDAQCMNVSTRSNFKNSNLLPSRPLVPFLPSLWRKLRGRSTACWVVFQSGKTGYGLVAIAFSSHDHTKAGVRHYGCGFLGLNNLELCHVRSMHIFALTFPGIFALVSSGNIYCYNRLEKCILPRSVNFHAQLYQLNRASLS